MSEENVQFDFNGVEARNEVGGFEPIEQGVYTGRIIKAEFGTSKAGNPKVTMDWKIEGGPFNGRTIRFQTLTFTKGWAGVIKGVMISLGLKVPTKLVNAEALAKAFARDSLNKIAQITVADGEADNEGRVYAEVKAIHPVGTPGAAVPEASDSGEEDLPTL